MVPATNPSVAPAHTNRPLFIPPSLCPRPLQVPRLQAADLLRQREGAGGQAPGLEQAQRLPRVHHLLHPGAAGGAVGGTEVGAGRLGGVGSEAVQ